MRRSLGTLLLLLCASVSAQVPQHVYGLYSERVPVCVAGATGWDCEAKGSNWLLVVPDLQGQAWLQASLIFQNGEVCRLEGNAEWVSGLLVTKQVGEAKSCELKVSFRGRRAILADENGECRRALCGFRGGFNGVSLPKKGSM